MHLNRRGGTYFWRRRLPQTLVPVLGRTEVTMSLRTQQRREALARARRVSVVADQFFETCSQESAGQGGRLLTTCLEALRRARDGSDAPPVPTGPKPAQEPSVTPQAPPEATPAEPSVSLSAAVETYLDAKVRDGQWKPITRRCHAPKLKLFAETLNDKPLAEVSRTDIRDWRDVLQDLDLSPNTIRLHFRIVSGLFNWAADEGLPVSSNPTRRLAPKGKEPNRDVFKPQELEQLFASPLFTGHWRKDRRERPGRELVKDHKYWFPLIALHSGMRAEEIAQLRTDDLVVEDGVPCFVIRASKTDAGRRLVPIHPTLIDMGLLRHGDGLQGGGSLWPELSKDREGRMATGFIQWWSGFRRLIGLDRDGLVFHSFRHTFVSALQRQNVFEDLAALIVGHQHGTITYGTYGGKLIGVEEMHEAVAGLAFPEIEALRDATQVAAA